MDLNKLTVNMWKKINKLESKPALYDNIARMMADTILENNKKRVNTSFVLISVFLELESMDISHLTNQGKIYCRKIF